MREVVAAIENQKPLILVLEQDVHRGGWTAEEACETCPDEIRNAIFGKLGLLWRDNLIPWMR